MASARSNTSQAEARGGVYAVSGPTSLQTTIRPQHRTEFKEEADYISNFLNCIMVLIFNK